MSPKPNQFASLYLLLGLLLAGLAGCSSVRTSEIAEVHLFGLPSALTLPASSAPVGVGIQIYATDPGGPRGLPIHRGRLEVLMFDQPVANLNPETDKPAKTWSFEPKDLEHFLSTTRMGIGYQLELLWGKDKPKGRSLTVIARYRVTGHPDIYSTSAAISTVLH